MAFYNNSMSILACVQFVGMVLIKWGKVEYNCGHSHILALFVISVR